MKRLLPLLVILAATFIIPVSVFSSDSANAQWKTEIVVSNNSTAASAVSTNFTLSTAEMIAAGMLNATATNAAMLINGVDVPFMFGWGANPGKVFVDSMPASSTKNAYLYSGNVTGGELVYFPSIAGGMTVLDNATLEGSSNFTICIDAYIDTESGIYPRDIIQKNLAFYIQIPAADVITSTITGGTTVTANGITPGHHQIRVNADSSNLTIMIDGVLKDNQSLGGVPMPNNGNGWLIGSGYTTIYIASANISVGGTPKSAWAWEYGAIFHDSIGANDATPVFCTTSSDADVSAIVVSMESLVEGSTPDSVMASSAWSMIGEVPSTPAGIYDEGGIAFPGGAEIQAVEDKARLPHGTFLFPFAFGTAILAGAFAFKLSHNESKGIKGSLMIMCFVIEGVLIFWYLIGGGVIPGWTLIPFGMFSAILLLWRNPFSPVS